MCCKDTGQIRLRVTMMDKQLVSLVPKLSVSFQDKIPLNLKNQPPSWKNNWTEKHLGLRLASQMERECEQKNH